jgi:hypothetical protein
MPSRFLHAFMLGYHTGLDRRFRLIVEAQDLIDIGEDALADLSILLQELLGILPALS